LARNLSTIGLTMDVITIHSEMDAMETFLVTVAIPIL